MEDVADSSDSDVSFKDAPAWPVEEPVAERPALAGAKGTEKRGRKWIGPVRRGIDKNWRRERNFRGRQPRKETWAEKMRRMEEEMDRREEEAERMLREARRMLEAARQEVGDGSRETPRVTFRGISGVPTGPAQRSRQSQQPPSRPQLPPRQQQQQQQQQQRQRQQQQQPPQPTPPSRQSLRRQGRLPPWRPFTTPDEINRDYEENRRRVLGPDTLESRRRETEETMREVRDGHRSSNVDNSNWATNVFHFGPSQGFGDLIAGQPQQQHQQQSTLEGQQEEQYLLPAFRETREDRMIKYGGARSESSDSDS